MGGHAPNANGMLGGGQGRDLHALVGGGWGWVGGTKQRVPLCNCKRRLGSRAGPRTGKEERGFLQKKGRKGSVAARLKGGGGGWGRRRWGGGGDGGWKGWVMGKETGSVSACSKRFSAGSRTKFWLMLSALRFDGSTAAMHHSLEALRRFLEWKGTPPRNNAKIRQEQAGNAKEKERDREREREQAPKSKKKKKKKKA